MSNYNPELTQKDVEVTAKSVVIDSLSIVGADGISVQKSLSINHNIVGTPIVANLSSYSGGSVSLPSMGAIIANMPSPNLIQGKIDSYLNVNQDGTRSPFGDLIRTLGVYADEIFSTSEYYSKLVNKTLLDVTQNSLIYKVYIEKALQEISTTSDAKVFVVNKIINELSVTADNIAFLNIFFRVFNENETPIEIFKKITSKVLSDSITKSDTYKVLVGKSANEIISNAEPVFIKTIAPYKQESLVPSEIKSFFLQKVLLDTEVVIEIFAKTVAKIVSDTTSSSESNIKAFGKTLSESQNYALSDYFSGDYSVTQFALDLAPLFITNKTLNDSPLLGELTSFFSIKHLSDSGGTSDSMIRTFNKVLEDTATTFDSISFVTEGVDLGVQKGVLDSNSYDIDYGTPYFADDYNYSKYASESLFSNLGKTTGIEAFSIIDDNIFNITKRLVDTSITNDTLKVINLSKVLNDSVVTIDYNVIDISVADFYKVLIEDSAFLEAGYMEPDYFIAGYASDIFSNLFSKVLNQEAISSSDFRTIQPFKVFNELSSLNDTSKLFNIFKVLTETYISNDTLRSVFISKQLVDDNHYDASGTFFFEDYSIVSYFTEDIDYLFNKVLNDNLISAEFNAKFITRGSLDASSLNDSLKVLNLSKVLNDSVVTIDFNIIDNSVADIAKVLTDNAISIEVFAKLFQKVLNQDFSITIDSKIVAVIKGVNEVTSLGDTLRVFIVNKTLNDTYTSLDTPSKFLAKSLQDSAVYTLEDYDSEFYFIDSYFSEVIFNSFTKILSDFTVNSDSNFKGIAKVLNDASILTEQTLRFISQKALSDNSITIDTFRLSGVKILSDLTVNLDSMSRLANKVLNELTSTSDAMKRDIEKALNDNTLTSDVIIAQLVSAGVDKTINETTDLYCAEDYNNSDFFQTSFMGETVSANEYYNILDEYFGEDYSQTSFGSEILSKSLNKPFSESTYDTELLLAYVQTYFDNDYNIEKYTEGTSYTLSAIPSNTYFVEDFTFTDYAI